MGNIVYHLESRCNYKTHDSNCLTVPILTDSDVSAAFAYRIVIGLISSHLFGYWIV